MTLKGKAKNRKEKKKHSQQRFSSNLGLNEVIKVLYIKISKSLQHKFCYLIEQKPKA